MKKKNSTVKDSKVLGNLLLNGEGEYGGASSALLYYQKNKTTKIAWQFIRVIGLVSSDDCRHKVLMCMDDDDFGVDEW